MGIIYEPKGKAGEYSDLAANLYTGCSHGCSYCYAPQVLHRDREVFHGNVEPRKDIIKNIKREAPRHKGKEVLLCFTCDPYCPEENDYRITRQAIRILHEAGVAVNILTKGGKGILRDTDLFTEHPELTRIGATLTFINPEDSRKWEPHGDVPLGRLEALAEASMMGVHTWVSLEPVIDPEQTLELIRQSAAFVDHYKVGRWNYDPRAKEIDWADFLHRAVELLDSYGASYYIKKDLAIFSERGIE
jgi:DNA repair photolyase